MPASRSLPADAAYSSQLEGTAVPAASNGYIVARAMGGDAELYADMLAWQTLLSMVAIPAYLALAASL